MCVFTMSIWACVAATIVITSKTANQILVARVLNCKLNLTKKPLRSLFYADIYIGMELAVVPIYQSEVTPSRARGFIVGTYQVSLYVRTDSYCFITFADRISSLED